MTRHERQCHTELLIAVKRVAVVAYVPQTSWKTKLLDIFRLLSTRLLSALTRQP